MAFKIIRADPQNNIHRDAIERLWKNNLHTISLGFTERIDWLYSQNPVGDVITCLAVDQESSEIIGCASILPRTFVMGGDIRQAGIAVDFAVDSNYRVFGPSLALQRKLVEEAAAEDLAFVLAFPNPAAKGVFKRMGYEPMGSGSRFSLLVKSKDKLRDLVPVLLPNTLVGIAAGVLDGLLWMGNHLRFDTAKQRYYVKETGKLDASVDSLWNRVQTNTGFQGEHSLNYMRWRYEKCPYRDYRFFLMFSEDRQLLSYLVYYLNDDEVLIDDFQFMNERHIPALFGHFWREMRRKKAKVINIGVVNWGKTLCQQLRKAGFSLRETANCGVVMLYSDSGYDWQESLQHEDWYLTDGEIDL